MCDQLKALRKAQRSQTMDALMQIVQLASGKIVSPRALATILLRRCCHEGNSNPTWWNSTFVVLRALLTEHKGDFAQLEHDTDMLWLGDWSNLQLGFAHADPT